MQTTRAIVLRKHRLTETSLICALMTEHHGAVRAAARGARRPKSRLAACLDLFCLSEVRIAPARRSDLHSLHEVVLLHPHDGIRSSYPRVLAASYFCALTQSCLPEGSPAPGVFTLLLQALGYLHRASPSRAAVRRFEARLAESLDLTPAHPDDDPARLLADLAGGLPPGRKILLDTLARASDDSG